MEQATPKPFILVLEDNPEQVILIQNAFQEDAASPQVESIAEGTEALNFIHRREGYTQAQRPDLILLNLHFAGGYGRVILKELKSSVALRRIPVVILTESDDEQDIFESYTLQGNSYIIKSLEHDRLEQSIQRIKEFWLGIVTLPLE
ncbi:response regulator [Leptolyngbya ohadii]|uniref:response regulator n=1 Tax=Leptolyngbya ohadii TaxID=1962290 RepID=UPI000B59C84F|nr:response regulator [Leptolyngbya ohadii]